MRLYRAANEHTIQHTHYRFLLGGGGKRKENKGGKKGGPVHFAKKLYIYASRQTTVKINTAKNRGVLTFAYDSNKNLFCTILCCTQDGVITYILSHRQSNLTIHFIMDTPDEPGICSFL